LRVLQQGAGTDEAVISEILASRSNAQLQTIKAKYNELFSRDLEKDIKSETSGNLERIYVSLLTVSGLDDWSTQGSAAPPDSLSSIVLISVLSDPLRLPLSVGN
jgi:hypothetical protein